MDDQIYEINIRRFIQSADYQLKKLNDCICRLNEFQSYEDWKNVKQAQLNGSQIIKRIKSDIKEIEKIRNQVVNNTNTDEKSSKEIIDKIDNQLKEIASKLKKETDEIDCLAAPYHRFEIKNQSFAIESSYDGPDMYNYEIEKDEYMAQDKDLCYAYEQLQKDCEDLKYIMEAFSHELFKQRPTIDSIEKNVLNAEENIESGSGSLRSALAYKSLTTAASGAVLGTLVGGPVGFLAGAKLGAVVGLSGGVAGYFLGKYMTKPSRE